MANWAGSVQRQLFASTALICAVTIATPAQAQERVRFNIASQSLDTALREFARQGKITIMADAHLTARKRSAKINVVAAPDAALRTLLNGSGLSFRRDGNVYVVVLKASAAEIQTAPPVPESASAPMEDSGEDIIVTAQKKEEKLQNVPIAVTAISAQGLDDHKIEGGSELVRAVPNVNFSKSNFSGYDFTIRGIGTKAISASNDPAVAVSFNNTPLIRNRLFEAEFFDLQRVEVLRGPQGTLYGRNATAGVVNVLPELPSHRFEADMKGEVGSYETRRLSGMVNLPLGDTLAVRVAGAMTKRQGFDYNTYTQKHVNGRDLWSTRATIAWEPSDRFKANFIWQHFEEDDNRSRTGKQLCTRDPGLTEVNGTAISPFLQNRFSQGCKPASLYDDAAFGAPNGASLAYIYYLQINMSMGRDPNSLRNLVFPINRGTDPYGNVVQSRNLREIETSYDPVFRANNDVFQLNMEAGLGDNLKLISQTAYSEDQYYSSQDYNRFLSAPVFNDSSILSSNPSNFVPVTSPGPTPGGIFTDPQLGASNRILSADLSRSDNRQWSQELRLQSSFDGPFNFNLGANYLDFKSLDDYFVYNNLFTFIAQYNYNRDISSFGGMATKNCGEPGGRRPDCLWVDPNPIGQGPEDGHNYFRSKNPVRTKSQALFGEFYWQPNEDLKFTLGLRYTHDKKIATPVPSQLLLGAHESIPDRPGPVSGGSITRGFHNLPDTVQKWGAFTGRFVVDWKPRFSFTDDSLLYASISRGYKGGGANPPRADINTKVIQYQPLPETFRPEYVTAFEIGSKNSFDGGRFILNASAFYNMYKDYQISQIVDRISLNENFNASTWGLELEAAWRPSRNFRLDATLGLLRTRIGKGAQSIDVMDRTQGNPDWMVLRPWIQVPSNCIAPKKHVEAILQYATLDEQKLLMLSALCAGAARFGTFNPDLPNVLPYYRYDLMLGFTYNPLTDAPNGGRGFYANLEGNELPNAPKYTFNVGAQYSVFLEGGDWKLTFRGDYYRQDKSFARVFNTEYDRLKAWDNANFAVTLSRGDGDFALQAYVKNIFDKAPITGTFTNSDDTGLSTNIFTLDPRIIGFSASVRF